MFQSYEEDFGKILNSLQKKIASAPSQSNEVRELAITEGSKEVQEADKCVSFYLVTSNGNRVINDGEWVKGFNG